ncbi:hypothetical protein BGW39_011116 [Mortierella sp. 14UC]|nr:hypothetical protein BGW39_011116 [Mortierella sp. 14UC]
MTKITASFIIRLQPILDTLLLYIDPSDYAACHLVCGNWYDAFNDRIWHGPPQPTRYLLQNQLTRLAFEEWGPPVATEAISWTNYRIAEELLARNRNSLKRVEFSLRFEAQPWGNFDHIYLKTSQTIIATMRNLTSLILKGPAVQLPISTLFKLLVHCPEQVEVLKIEHPIQPMSLYTWNHLRQWDLGPTLWGATTTPLLEDACIWDGRSCRCLVHLNEIWSQPLPTRIRVLSLPSLSNTEEDRPILLPFMKRRCPVLESLKIKTLGYLPLATLKSTLNADVFPDLRHLEFDGVRKSGERNYQPSVMFPVYDLALHACTALESLTISADSDLVEEVPALVEMVLKRHGKTLRVIRWLGSGGNVNERLDLQWFLNAFVTVAVTVTATVIINTVTILAQTIKDPIPTQSSNTITIRVIILGLCIDSNVPRDQLPPFAQYQERVPVQNPD